MTLSSLALALSLFPTATEAASSSEAPVARSVRECPAVFGPAETRDAVVARRADSLESVVEDRYGVVVFHHVGRWAAPKSAPLAGLSLVDVDRDHARLTFDVRAPLEGCAEGRYVVDEAVPLGADAVVIASLRDGVLVEKGRGLTFVPVEGRAAPRFRLVWRSPYAIVRDQPAGGAAVSSGGKRPAVTTAAPPTPETASLKSAAARREKRSKKK